MAAPWGTAKTQRQRFPCYWSIGTVFVCVVKPSTSPFDILAVFSLAKLYTVNNRTGAQKPVRDIEITRGTSTMTKAFLTLLSASLLIMITSASAGMYRWVDDQGNVVYSQQPPPDNRASKNIAPPPPPAESPEDSLEKSRELNKKLDAIQKERNKARQERLKAKSERKERKARCSSAQKDLKTLMERPSNTLYRTGEDEWQRFTQEERSERIGKLKEVIKENCK
jgi:hypothetical protein